MQPAEKKYHDHAEFYSHHSFAPYFKMFFMEKFAFHLNPLPIL